MQEKKQFQQPKDGSLTNDRWLPSRQRKFSQLLWIPCFFLICIASMEIRVVDAAGGNPGGPNKTPTFSPTSFSNAPTVSPTIATYAPTMAPTTTSPTLMPTTTAPTTAPPTILPTTVAPSLNPTLGPTRNMPTPKGAPNPSPTIIPTQCPTTTSPTAAPTTNLTTMSITIEPSTNPITMPPTVVPSHEPTVIPTKAPRGAPIPLPTIIPTLSPTTTIPTATPTTNVTTMSFSIEPSTSPIIMPPTVAPSSEPTVVPTKAPKGAPNVPNPIPAPVALPPFANKPIAPTALPTIDIPTRTPTAPPTINPTNQPTSQPSNQPSTKPTSPPSSQPTLQPTSSPSGTPTAQPSPTPSTQPSNQPTSSPSAQPTIQPSSLPTNIPSGQPSAHPTALPTEDPTSQPTVIPSGQPTVSPSSVPTKHPSSIPSGVPTSVPTGQPSVHPSSQPTAFPTSIPSSIPTSQPSTIPSQSPTSGPTTQPSEIPSSVPSTQPSMAPTSQPSSHPTTYPTTQPSTTPTSEPSSRPTSLPSSSPSSSPTGQPSAVPSSQPSSVPSIVPTSQPTGQPSAHPSSQPSSRPSSRPSIVPTSQPSSEPSSSPTSMPSAVPTDAPTMVPSVLPSSAPTSQPSSAPTGMPTSLPSSQPSSFPSSEPTSVPTSTPTVTPTALPTVAPTSSPSSVPSSAPTTAPSNRPTSLPSSSPSTQPTAQPSGQPSRQPTSQPTAPPTNQPTTQPTSSPSSEPTRKPSSQPTGQPTTRPTGQPTAQPTGQPSSRPTAFPSANPSTAPLSKPTSVPSVYPTAEPTVGPTLVLTPEVITMTVFEITRAIVVVNVTLDNNGVVSAGIYPSISTQPSNVDQIRSMNLKKQSKDRMVTFVFNELLPAASYHIYFVAESSVGRVSSWDTVESSNKLTITTQCCREITWKQSLTTVIEKKDVLNFLTLTMLPSPSIPFSLPLKLIQMGSNTSYTSNLVPQMLNIPASSANQLVSFQVSISRLIPGDYKLVIDIPVEMQNIYSFSTYPDHWVQTFDLNVYEAGTPLIESVSFNKDGSFLVISTNKPTNRMDISLNAYFDCSLLFEFPCSSASTGTKCQWVDSKTVYAVVSAADSCASPGSTFKLSSSAKIKAACPGTAAEVIASCRSWPNMNITQAFTIAAPTQPLAPSVVLSIPAIISSCGSLLLDATPSTGHGGRNWRHSQLAVTVTDELGAENTNATDLINAFLQDNFRVSPPMKIPSLYWIAENSYTFTLTLCNFLGACSQTTKSIWVSSDTALSLVIPGASNRTLVTPFQSLTLAAIASVTQCDASSISSIRYRWNIYKSGVLQTNIVSSSKDPSKLSLPANALEKNSFYTMEVTAIAGTKSTSSKVDVYVGSGGLQLIVNGGGSAMPRAIRLGRTLILDASRSFDENLPRTLTGSAAGLIYTWSCMQTVPMLSFDCDNVLTLNATSAVVSSSSRAWIVKSDTDIVGSKVMVTITITDSDRSRSVSASIEVTILPSLAATMSLTSNVPPAIGSINPDKQVQILAKVSIPGSLSGNLSWSLGNGDDSFNDAASLLDLPSIALTPVRQIVTAIPLLDYQIVTMNLVLPKDVLIGGMTYNFRLHSSLAAPGTSSSAIIAIAVNEPPRPGVFSISPSSGQELFDDFFFSCYNWFDNELPLTYQFGYWSSSSSSASSKSLIVVRSKLELSSTSLVLPAGSASKNFTVLCVADVFDSLSARTQASENVIVTEASAINDNDLNQYLLASLSSLIVEGTGNKTSDVAINVDSIKQSVAISAYLLNRIDCSSAPNCSSLNRSPCQSVVNTCGSCQAGYLGVAGHGNSPCLSLEDWLEDQSHANGTNSDSSKSCIQDCNSHGICSYFKTPTDEYLGNEVDGGNCSVMSLDCYAECVCLPGYAGSVCEYTEEEFTQRIEFRKQMITGISSLRNFDTSADEFDVLMGVMNEALVQVEQVSSESANLVLQFAAEALRGVSSLEEDTAMSTSTLNTLVETLDNMAEVFSLEALQASRRKRIRRLIEADTVNHTAETAETSYDQGFSVINTLQQFTSVYANALAVGQEAVSFNTKNFQMNIGAYDLSSSTAANAEIANAHVSEDRERSGNLNIESNIMWFRNITVELPQSSLGIFLQTPPNRLIVPVQSTSTYKGEDTSESDSEFQNRLTISSLSLSNKLFPNQVFDSNPTGIHLSSLPCGSSSSDCEVTMVLQRNTMSSSDTKEAVVHNEEVVSLTCADDYVGKNSTTCLNGHSVTIQCNGTAAIFTQRCPATYMQPSCSMLEPTAKSENVPATKNCRLLTYNDATVTCACSLSTISSAKRMLSVTNNSTASVVETEISINYVSMLNTITETFTGTVLSAATLDASAIEKGWQSLVVVGTLAVAILSLMYTGHYLDEQANQEQEQLKKNREEKHGRVVPVPDQSSETTAPPLSRAKRLTSFFSSSLSLTSSAHPPRKTQISRIKGAVNKHGVTVSSAESSSASSSSSFLKIAEEALPKVLSSRSLVSRYKDELKQHHRWAGVFFHYTKKFPRALRVLALSTNIITMLFIQSITYNLTNGDDGSCERLHSEVTCIEPESGFATGASKCYWVDDASLKYGGSCHFIQPDSDLTLIIFVAIFSAVVSTPIALTANWAIQHILSAPTDTSYGRKKQLARAVQQVTVVPSGFGVIGKQMIKSDKLSNASSVVPISATSVVTEKTQHQVAINNRRRRMDFKLMQSVSDEMVWMKQADKSYNKLQERLKAYRTTLTDPEALSEFDSVWGLDSEGLFIRLDDHNIRINPDTPAAAANSRSKLLFSKIARFFTKIKIMLMNLYHDQRKPSTSIAEIVMSELQSLYQNYREEKTRFRYEYSTEKEKSKRLLYLFQKDLMPGISGQILEAKDRRDEIIQHGVSRSLKLITWFGIALLNSCMLFYIFLFAVSQEVPRQRAWAQSFAMWLVMEVLLVSSAIVLVTHVLIPSLVMSDVSKIKVRLLNSLQDYHKKMTLAERNPSDVQRNESSDSDTDSDRECAEEKKDASETAYKIETQRVDKQRNSPVIKDPTKFNAAKYLFLSYKMAHVYPELKIAQIISEFSTPWPKQSYHRATDVTKSYDTKFQAITKAATMILMFFITSFIRIPPAIQDMIMQMCTTAVTGYTVLIHIQLYKIYPVLIAIPTLLIAAIIHFFVQSGKANSKLEFARLFGSTQSNQANANGNTAVATVGVSGEKEESIIKGEVVTKPDAFETTSLTGVDATANIVSKGTGKGISWFGNNKSAVVPLASSVSSANSNYSKILENDASRHRVHPHPPSEDSLQQLPQHLHHKQQPLDKHHRDRRQSLAHGLDIARRAHAVFDGTEGEKLLALAEHGDDSEEYSLSLSENDSILDSSMNTSTEVNEQIHAHHSSEDSLYLAKELLQIVNKASSSRHESDYSNQEFSSLEISSEDEDASSSSSSSSRSCPLSSSVNDVSPRLPSAGQSKMIVSKLHGDVKKQECNTNDSAFDDISEISLSDYHTEDTK